jgi:NADH-quinone oxidoreductase subunit K
LGNFKTGRIAGFQLQITRLQNYQFSLSGSRVEVAMVPITTLHYLVVAAALFVLGVIGVLTRRNVVIVLMSIELILNAVNLNLVAFSRIWGLHGQIFAIFVITDAAAEAAVGLGILIAFFRNKETINVDEVDLMKW